MFLRLEIFGHYLEVGKTVDSEPAEPVPDNVPQPMQVYVEPVGFRLLGQDGYMADDMKIAPPPSA